MPRLVRLAVAVAVALALLAGAESARGAALVAFEGNVATYSGSPGEAHALIVSQLAAGQIEFREPGVVAGNGCAQIASDKVHCPTSFAGGIKVSLGTLADTLDAVKGVTLPVEAIGNAGDDVLKTGTSNDTLRGGEGNDTLDPSLASVPQVAGEQNTLFGGPGGDRFVLGGSLGADKVTGGDTPVPKPLPPGNSNGDGFGTDVADYSGRPAGQAAWPSTSAPAA